MEMLIRDSHAKINGDNTVITLPSGGLDIINNAGETLFSIDLNGATLNIDAGNVCKLNGNIMDDRFIIAPIAANRIHITKLTYKKAN